jgi:beta-carotene 3-hydroxylase
MTLAVVLVLIGFLGMELVTYVVHRFVMHGVLERLHVSHHRNAAAEFAKKSFEPNDMFPLAFSVVVLAAMWVGFNVPSMQWLVPLFVGVTVYGVVYTVIHDGVIHGRVRWMKRLTTDKTNDVRTGIAESLSLAHRAHHRTNAEPYGMLFPQLTMRDRAPNDAARRRVAARGFSSR